jgi:hypothetical protein
LRHGAAIEVDSELWNDNENTYSLEDLSEDFPKLLEAPTPLPTLSAAAATTASASVGVGVGSSSGGGMGSGSGVGSGVGSGGANSGETVFRLQRRLAEAIRQGLKEKAEIIKMQLVAITNAGVINGNGVSGGSGGGGGGVGVNGGGDGRSKANDHLSYPRPTSVSTLQ